MQYPDPNIPKLTIAEEILLTIWIIESDQDDIEVLRTHVSRDTLQKLSSRELESIVNRVQDICRVVLARLKSSQKDNDSDLHYIDEWAIYTPVISQDERIIREARSQLHISLLRDIRRDCIDILDTRSEGDTN